jgi:hypothetical protein
MVLLGPFVDSYSSTTGAHFQLHVGWDRVHWDGGHTGTGVGVAPAVGYDGWVGKQSSLGVLGRLYMGTTSERFVAALAVMLAYTYH